MTYRVTFAPRFLNDVDRQIEYLLSEHVAITTIERWFGDLYDKLEGLYHWPLRFPISPEQTEDMGYEVRRLNYGDYQVFYRVDEDARLVEVIHFRHGSRQKDE